MADDKEKKTSGPRRAAQFMLALDPPTAAALMQRMSEREVGMLSEEMTRVGDMSSDEAEDLLKLFASASGADTIDVEPMLQDILERALGKEKAKELLDKIRRQAREVEPFRSLQALNAKQVTQILRGEHPQVVSIVLGHLQAPVASEVMKDMEENLRYDVIKRIASTEEVPAELIRQIDEMMEVRAFAMARRGMEPPKDARFKTVAQMLNISEPSLSKAVLDRLTKESPQLANEIQGLMFVFEDLAKIDGKGIQKILGEVDKGDLTVALRGAPPDIATKLMDNLSARAREAMKEEIENMGPKPLSEVEAAQKRILQVVRGMEERGEIQLNRGAGEAMV